LVITGGCQGMLEFNDMPDSGQNQNPDLVDMEAPDLPASTDVRVPVDADMTEDVQQDLDPIDPCANTTCGANATCVSDTGICECNSGYGGDAAAGCMPLDPCAST